jgi:galactoside 2-L-fucosyltransferase 1/2
MLAAMLYLSERTERHVIMKSNGWCLDETFDIKMFRFRTTDPPPPIKTLHPPGIYKPDPQLSTNKGLSQLRNATERTLALCGLYQTFHYADAVGVSLRRLLVFKPEVHQSAQTFLDKNRPANWSAGSYFRVGVHVRRGDFMTSGEPEHGLTVIDEQYLNNSMNYFISRHQRVQFIIATEDIIWTRNALKQLFFTKISFIDKTLNTYGELYISKSAAVTFSVRQTTGSDLAILVSCDAVIMSTGSFSWWAAWLNNKTVIYYANWPGRGTRFERELDRIEHFPSRWIPMT